MWHMKNSSLAKQVEEATTKLQEAVQNREKMHTRRQHLHAKWESEDTKKEVTQEQQMQQQQELQMEEEKQHRAEIQSLLEARKCSSRSTESTLKERARHLEELRKQQAESWQPCRVDAACSCASTVLAQGQRGPFGTVEDN